VTCAHLASRGAAYCAPTKTIPQCGSRHHRLHSSSRIFVLRETHETPGNVTQRLLRAGGINRFGEPNYRAVWGWNRLGWIGGKFEEHDPATGSFLREVVELRQEPKYPAVNRWHIERWVAPEAYGSPRMWYAQTIERENGISIPALGPYPSRGEYEHCFTLEGPRGEFLQLTPTRGICRVPASGVPWMTGNGVKIAPTMRGLTTSSITPSQRSTNSPSSRWLNA
jgi:hypothetical protein